MKKISSSGLWRFEAIYYGLKYAASKRDKLNVLASEFVKPPYAMDTPYGKFYCPDLASASQFNPKWEIEIREEILKLKNGLFVDVGANIGFYSVLASKNKNRVIALEPHPLTYRYLYTNLRENECKDFSTLNVAAWNKEEWIPYYLKAHTDIGNVKGNGREVGKVHAQTLDSILSVNVPDLIKIDVEGAELEVLQGAEQMLAISRPTVIFEALNDSSYMPTAEFLQRFGYTVSKLDATNYLADIQK